MVNDTISGSIKVGTLAEIPCYYEIQFREREYLTVSELPNHSFSIKIDELVEKIKAYA
jgi:chromosome partitioning protein